MIDLFFHTLLGFTPFWDYKPTNSNRDVIPGVYTSNKILNLSSTNKTHLKCDCIDGSIQDGVRQFCLVLFWINRVDTKFFPNLKQFIIKK